MIATNQEYSVKQIEEAIVRICNVLGRNYHLDNYSSYEDDKTKLFVYFNPKMTSVSVDVLFSSTDRERVFHKDDYSCGIFRPGKWIDYVMETLIQKVELSIEKDKDRKKNKFNPIDDSKIFS